jgi:hypothetical protein
MTDQAYAFAPLQTQTVSLSVGAASTNVALPAAVIAAIKAGAAPQLQIYNAGPNVAFVNVGAAGLVALVPNGATPGDFPVPPNPYPTVITVIAGQNDAVLAAICPSGGTATLYISPGTGI